MQTIIQLVISWKKVRINEHDEIKIRLKEKFGITENVTKWPTNSNSLEKHQYGDLHPSFKRHCII